MNSCRTPPALADFLPSCRELGIQHLIEPAVPSVHQLPACSVSTSGDGNVYSFSLLELWMQGSIKPMTHFHQPKKCQILQIHREELVNIAI